VKQKSRGGDGRENEYPCPATHLRRFKTKDRNPEEGNRTASRKVGNTARERKTFAYQKRGIEEELKNTTLWSMEHIESFILNSYQGFCIV
jgi:hypothetical protein